MKQHILSLFEFYMEQFKYKKNRITLFFDHLIVK